MNTLFVIVAIIGFLLVIPAAGMTDRSSSEKTGNFLLGAALVMFVLGVAGCIGTR